MIKIPKLPEKQELEFREQEFMVNLREQLNASSRNLLYALAVFVVLYLPLQLVLTGLLSRAFIASYEPPAVNENLYDPEDLETLRTGILRPAPGVFSAYAQVLNPNPELMAWDLKIRFVFLSDGGRKIAEAEVSDFIRRGESKFLVLPSIRLGQEPARLEVELAEVRWSGQEPKFDTAFEIVQVQSGVTAENNFFVQAVVKNLRGFGLDKVNIRVLVFDSTNTDPVAVNRTEFTDHKPHEDRFVRVLWPRPVENTGQIQVFAEVSPLDPGVTLPREDGVPVR